MKPVLVLPLVAFATAVGAFSVPQQSAAQKVESTQSKRRDFLSAAIVGGATLLISADAADATGSTFFYDDKIEEHPVEPSQMATGGKVDLNSAFVNEYMSFRGMFPHAAGKIASHGPYNRVSDIYHIPDLTDHDVALFRQYEAEFTVNPPGRAFAERINARVST